MNLRSRNGFLLLLLLLSAAVLSAQSRVNPTVKVLPRASAPVPAECDEGLAPPAVPRVQTAEVQPVERDRATDLLPPPSRDLRGQLSDALEAAERGDRESFRTALAASKETLSNYPSGGERTAANEAVAVFTDIDRLWEYQYASPVGAFFDETVQGGNLLASLRKYRGYDDFIRKNIITDSNGIKLYPTRESRDFLTREATDRLARVGVMPVRPRTATTPSPTPTQTTTSTPAPRTTTPRTTTTTKPKPSQVARVEKPKTPRKSSSTRTTSKPAASKPAASKPVASKPAVTKPAPEKPKPEPVKQPAPAPAPKPVPTETLAPAPPVVTETVAPTTTTATASTETTATETTATATDTTDTTTTTSAEAPATTTGTTRQPARRNVIFPIILILIGVGVLIVLFRASS